MLFKSSLDLGRIQWDTRSAYEISEGRSGTKMEGFACLVYITTLTLKDLKQPFYYCSSWPWTSAQWKLVLVLQCLFLTVPGTGKAWGWSSISLFLCCLRPLLESPTWQSWGSRDLLWIRVFWDSGRGSCQSARPWAHDFCCILLVKALTKPAQNLEEEINPSSSGKCIKEFVTVSNPHRDSK